MTKRWVGKYAKEADEATWIAASCISLSTQRQYLKTALRIIYKHSRKDSVRAEASRLYALIGD